MTVLTFNYTDAKNKSTTRTAFVLAQPSDNYMTIDLSEFDKEERDSYIEALSQMRETIKNLQSEMLDEMGLKHNYRYFKEERMSDVQTV